MLLLRVEKLEPAPGLRTYEQASKWYRGKYLLHYDCAMKNKLISTLELSYAVFHKVVSTCIVLAYAAWQLVLTSVIPCPSHSR
jgi:hypothetical protein